MTTCLTHTEEYIKKLYFKIGVFTPQDLHFPNISNRLGITIFYWAEESQAHLSSNRSYILLNETLSEQQQWQEFCHELPHVLLHAGRQMRLPKLFVEYQEYKANHFMYHACVPTFMLDEIGISDLSAKSVYKVQSTFNVEQDFAVKRLTDYLERKQSISFWNTLTQLSVVHI